MQERDRARAAAPSDESGSYPIVYRLPEEMLEGGVQRLGLVGFGLGGTLSVALVMHHVARGAGYQELAGALMGGLWGNLVAATLVTLCFALMAVARSGRLEAQFVLDLGLVFAVLASFGLAMLEHLVRWPADEVVRGVSWVCVWIVLFPAMIPGTPGKILLAVTASAVMGPLSYVVMVAAGHPMSGPVTVAGLYLPHAASVILAMMVSRAFYGLGKKFARARQMGNYELVESLGMGGMGEVWRAKHRRLGREAAVKFVRRRDYSPDSEGKSRATTLLRRFEREAAATAKLRSIHTVELYDFGAAQDGTLYYVMELLDGMDLDTLVVRHGPLPPGRAIYLLRQACASLAEAHERGLVHRDIKPSNLFSCHLAYDVDLLKVLDFGLVGGTEPAHGEGAPLTHEGVLDGTPPFIAPEMILDPKHANHRADIYALGCVAYWLVTGELPFGGETAVKVMMAHINDAPVAPSQRTENPVPKDLEDVILSCLEKDPDVRPQNAMQVASLLDGCESAGSWSVQHARAWWKDNEGVSTTQ